MEEDVLDAILERLHQKVYIENSVIMRPKYPVDQMLFILRGKLTSIGDDSSKEQLGEGNFCGEELLIWSLEQAAIQPGRYHYLSLLFASESLFIFLLQ